MNAPTRILSAIALFSFTLVAHALSDQPTADQPVALPGISPTTPGLHVVLNGGLTYGGDTIATAIYTDGTTTTIKGGSLMQLGIGGLYQFQDKPLALMLSANYHFDNASGSNGSITFSRIPVEVLAYYTGKDRFRIGGGLRIVNSPEYNSTVSGNKIIFDNSTGLVGEIGYHLTKQGWLNFRFVSEKYKVKSSNVVIVGTPYSGSHMGVNFTYEF